MGDNFHVCKFLSNFSLPVAVLWTGGLDNLIWEGGSLEWGHSCFPTYMDYLHPFPSEFRAGYGTETAHNDLWCGQVDMCPFLPYLTSWQLSYHQPCILLDQFRGPEMDVVMLLPSLVTLFAWD